MDYRVYWKEDLYFAIKVVTTIAILVGAGYYGATAEGARANIALGLLPFIIYALFIALFLFIRHGLVIGHLRGNAVRVTDTQFSEVNSMLESHVQRLGLGQVPPMYILQAEGALNAFASRFLGSDYIVLFSDVLEVAYEGGPEVVSFIVAHELGHVRRRHMTKNWVLFPSRLIPFLHPAYSRACEYTCDNIGCALCHEGAAKAMLILGVGKRLWARLNPQHLVEQSQTEQGFWKWFAEIVSTHPNLPKRLARCLHQDAASHRDR